MADSLGEVFVLKTTDRATGVPALLNKFDLDDYSGKQVALKLILTVLTHFQLQPT